jgi:hypothetical protein
MYSPRLTCIQGAQYCGSKDKPAIKGSRKILSHSEAFVLLDFSHVEARPVLSSPARDTTEDRYPGEVSRRSSIFLLGAIFVSASWCWAMRS